MLNAKPTFDMKQKTYKEEKTLNERGTKKFQERIAQEAVAEAEIKQFTLDQGETIDNDEHITFP